MGFFVFIIFFLIFIFFVFVGIGLAILNGVFRFLGFGKNAQRQDYTRKNDRQNTETEEPSKEEKKKIFDKDEGEYVDYEEVKDEP